MPDVDCVAATIHRGVADATCYAFPVECRRYHAVFECRHCGDDETQEYPGLTVEAIERLWRLWLEEHSHE